MSTKASISNGWGVEWNYLLMCFPTGKISDEIKEIISAKIKECLMRENKVPKSLLKGFTEDYGIEWVPNSLIPSEAPLFYQKVHMSDEGVKIWMDVVKEKIKVEIDEHLENLKLNVKPKSWHLYMYATAALRYGVDRNSAGRISFTR